jgi:hypothetical protein
VIVSKTLLPAVICLTFAIPLTKELDSSNILAKNHPIAKRYWISVLLLTVIFLSITFLIYWFGSFIIQIGYTLGFMYVFFKIIFNIKQIGINRENVSEYVDSSFNAKYFCKIIPSELTPAEDILNQIYSRVFYDTANILSLRMAKNEGLKGDALKATGIAILRDSARIEPEIEAGKIVRKKSQEQAAEITQLVRRPRQKALSDDEIAWFKEFFRNDPISGFSEEKKKRLAEEDKNMSDGIK